MAARRVIEPVVKASTPSIIADTLRAAINKGTFSAGEQLQEVELASAFGVSRGPLREGMQRLTQEGLLVSIPNRGVFVVELTSDDVRDVYVAREAIERAAAVEIFAGNPEKAAAKLIKICDEMARAADREDTVGVGHWDIKFHECLVAMAKSTRLSRIHRTLLTETRLCISALGGTYPPPDERVPEHRALAEAVRAADPEPFFRLLTDHMDDAVQRLSKVVPPTSKRER